MIIVGSICIKLYFQIKDISVDMHNLLQSFFTFKMEL